MHHGWLDCRAGGHRQGDAGLPAGTLRPGEPHERDPFAQSLATAEDTRARRVRCARCRIPACSSCGAPTTPRPSASRPRSRSTRCGGCAISSACAASDGAWRVVIVDTRRRSQSQCGQRAAEISRRAAAPHALPAAVVGARAGCCPPSGRACRTLDLAALEAEPLRQRRAASIDREHRGRDELAAGADRMERSWSDLAEGSVRRLLGLRGGGGIAALQAPNDLVGALPKLDWAAVHTLSDELWRYGGRTAFRAVFRAAARDAFAAGPRRGGCGRAAIRKMPNWPPPHRRARLATWAELWETIVAEKADADAAEPRPQVPDRECLFAARRGLTRRGGLAANRYEIARRDCPATARSQRGPYEAA